MEALASSLTVVFTVLEEDLTFAEAAGAGAAGGAEVVLVSECEGAC
jgi:hypothetical protein